MVERFPEQITHVEVIEIDPGNSPFRHASSSPKLFLRAIAETRSMRHGNGAFDKVIARNCAAAG